MKSRFFIVVLAVFIIFSCDHFVNLGDKSVRTILKGCLMRSTKVKIPTRQTPGITMIGMKTVLPIPILMMKAKTLLLMTALSRVSRVNREIRMKMQILTLIPIMMQMTRHMNSRMRIRAVSRTAIRSRKNSHTPTVMIAARLPIMSLSAATALFPFSIRALQNVMQ